MLRKYLLIIYFIFSIPLVYAQVEKEYGLQFHSYEVEKENRTELNLTPVNPFSFPEGFLLEFDIKFERVHHIFGYVFRIIGEDNQHLDLVLGRKTDEPDLSPYLSFIYERGKVIYQGTFDELQVDYGQWTKVRVAINQKRNRLEIKLNDKEFNSENMLFSGFKNIHLVFGKNNLLSYQVSDVPAMAVKNILLKDNKGKVRYSWPLAQYADKGVYDSVKHQFASVENPVWLVDNYAYWKKEISFPAKLYPKVTYNSNDDVVVVADSSCFYFYKVGNGLRVDTIKGGSMTGNLSNQLIYNKKEETYFTYDFTKKAAQYDPQTKSWNNHINIFEDSHYWHHTRYFSIPENKLYTFGGYGFHIYKNDVNVYNFISGQWNKLPLQGSGISPRYLSGLGTMDENTILIFGGYGNESGKQELSPRNYYDLYEVDLPALTTRKKWELPFVDTDFVVANSLVVDTSNRCFYALCFPQHKFNTQLQLCRFSLDKPHYDLLADSIPYLFNDGFSYADLYVNADSTRLIAVTIYNDEEAASSIISIYSLNFPPLQKSDLFQQTHLPDKKVFNIFIIFFSAFIILFYLTRKVRRKSGGKSKKEIAAKEENLPVSPEKKNESRKSSVLLFGNFRVLDKNGTDISSKFTPVLKHLFLLILFYTYKDEKGISSQKLNEILWFDKDKDKAKNNRGVSISKLRLIFETVGDVEINNRNSNWFIELGTEVYCDYFKAVSLMEHLMEDSFNRQVIEELVTIVSNGELLADVPVDWADNFKADFSNRLIDVLIAFVNSTTDVSSSLKIKIADAIFVYDSLNEDALTMKCVELLKTGKNGLAKKVYEAFAREYKTAFGTEFKTTFEQLIS
ncbi:MAG: hypothetical protein LUG18_06175 [Candidatus Azobacteroides sp.]|nr:hypothetical protein [Candidatus Azobacteroides sp.]